MMDELGIISQIRLGCGDVGELVMAQAAQQRMRAAVTATAPRTSHPIMISIFFLATLIKI